MRNLKKLLALVLAMMMAFSLMLTANAANPVRDYPDADQADEAFEEAIDVLTGMKVYSGDNGNFKPAANITRAEVAALIYRLATGDVTDSQANLYAEYGNFPDVPHDAWYAGYVGYCANAGYIKGRSNGNFDPSGNVTGYEALAMILRAIGYDKNGEFTGSTWQTEVSALSQQLGILDNVKTTQYGGTLYLAARRDVVADLLFRADAYVPMVIYTPAFGYQPYGMVNGGSGGSLIGSENQPNPTLGERIFGLDWDDDGILLGNEQTGQAAGKSVMGYSSKEVINDTTKVKATLGAAVPAYSAYTWNGAKVYNNGTDNFTANANVTYTLKTGIDLIGHNLGLWYDNGNGTASKSGKPVYAYFDQAKTEVVYADDTDLITDDDDDPDNTTLAEAIAAAGMKVASNDKAVFNNSFGKFGIGTAPTANSTPVADNTWAPGNAAEVGNGVAGTAASGIASPVNLYKIIDNNGDGVVDAVISLNIESSRITEANNVNRVPTIGVPVSNAGTTDGGTTKATIAADAQVQTKFIDTDNVTAVNGVDTGVIAQAALVGNSTKALGDYEFGIHITGTTVRSPSNAEVVAVKSTNVVDTNFVETAYFLMNQVTAPVQGTVVAYNVNKGTVTLDNGTVLERSKYYHTVVGWDDNETNANTPPASKIPQAWMYNGTKWIEGYANVGYKFYLDHEGKYLGAERAYGSTFLYGTYLDYDQKVSTSSFNYYLTGVNLDGEIETVQVSKYWDDTNPVAASDVVKNITGTDLLGIPYRATAGGADSSQVVNGIGEGMYTGFAITGDTVDSYTADTGVNKNEYLNNMARLGVKVANGNGVDTNTTIDSDSIILGAEVVGNTPGAGTNKYFTEATKFILVSGIGTDTVKAEVYEGISKLKGASSSVILKLGDQTTTATGALYIPHIKDSKNIDDMTYFKESAYTYAQSGDTDKKIDVIVLPKAAVTWTGGSSLYYVGDPTPSLVNSWGTDAWKYNLYMDGELQQVWLTNDPSDNASGNAGSKGSPNDTYTLVNDTFMNLKSTGKVANDGQPIYTAGYYDPSDGVFTGGAYLTNADKTTLLPAANGVTYLTDATYSAITRDAQTATFEDGNNAKVLLRVAEAKVVNLNAKENCFTTPAYGYIWPGITDLSTLNQAGSIDPVTGRALKVAAVIDSSNPLVVTCIYVCYDQTP